MKPTRNLICLLFTLFALSACSSGPTLEDYQAFEPVFVPETFFDGQLTAHGVVKNRSGDVIRTFNADIKAWWEDGVGTLDEDFVFNDGEQQKRIWTLTPNGDGSYRATAGDVIGEGVGRTNGNAFNLQYVLQIAYKDGTLDLNVDDWMWLVSENVIINHSVMRKFGFRVGEIELTIIRHPES